MDSVLAGAALKIASSSLKRELLICQEQRTAAGQPLRGRRALFMVNHRYRIESGGKHQVDIKTFTEINF